MDTVVHQEQDKIQETKAEPQEGYGARSLEEKYISNMKVPKT